MMEDLLLTHTSTTSCSHGYITPLKQGKSVDTSKVLFTPYGRIVGVFHCDNINETLHSGECGTGSEQLHFWGTTTIWCPGVMGVNFRFWVVGGKLHHLAGLPGGGGESVFVIL
jgi:hypothetical protein